MRITMKPGGAALFAELFTPLLPESNTSNNNNNNNIHFY